MSLILCGLPGVGKSSIGKDVAMRLGWRFVDTDQMLELEGIHPNNRENFQDHEKQCISSLVSYCVIATGGGSLLAFDNVQNLRSIGILIYLKVDPKTMHERLLSEEIPSYLDYRNPMDSLNTLIQQRIPLYEKYCDLQINLENHSKEQVIAKISNLGQGNQWQALLFERTLHQETREPLVL